MYVPRVFEAASEAKSGFGWLVVEGPDGLVETPVPFVVEGEDLLFHVAAKNPVAVLLAAGAASGDAGGYRAKMLLLGPHAYVSPTHYAPSRTTQVPTWNYEASVWEGTLAAADLSLVLDRSVACFEPSLQFEEGALSHLLPAIVGGRLRVTSTHSKAKLSQNRDSEDRKRVANAMWRLGEFAVAEQMHLASTREARHFDEGFEAARSRPQSDFPAAIHSPAGTTLSVAQELVMEEVTDAALPAIFPLMGTLREALDLPTFLSRVRAARSIGYRIVAAREGGILVGCIGFRPVTTLARGAHIHIDDLIVAEERQGSGVGTALLSFVEELSHAFSEADGEPTPHVYLDARPTALSFYEQKGYSVHSAPVVKKLLG